MGGLVGYAHGEFVEWEHRKHGRPEPTSIDAE
jgi:hypothetical protein